MAYGCAIDEGEVGEARSRRGVHGERTMMGEARGAEAAVARSGVQGVRRVSEANERVVLADESESEGESAMPMPSSVRERGGGTGKESARRVLEGDEEKDKEEEEDVLATDAPSPSLSASESEAESPHAPSSARRALAGSITSLSL
jgi:hypothetical protein